MGRIKSLMVKRAAKQLLGNENIFTENFHNNKKILSSSMPSKPIRNKIAGYIARLIKMKKLAALKPVVVKKIEEEQSEQYQ